jgi:hypothetical protein
VRKGDPPAAKEIEVGHGRRVNYILESTVALNDYLEWPGVQQAFRLRHVTRKPKAGQPQEEVFYGITSLSPKRASPKALIALWREHWHIEKGVHWVRDTVFEEDAFRMRKGDLPQAMATLRNLVLNVLRIYGYPSIRAARTRFGADLQHALSLLT